MNALKIGLVIAHQGLWNEAQACLRTLPVRILLQQQALGEPAVFLDQIEALRPDVLLIDLTHLEQSFEQIIKRIKSTSAPPQVIAISDAADPEIILSAIRAGANEFLYPPLEAGLHKALERLANERMRHQSAARQRGKTLGFVAAKGGCGATTVACHVAAELQRSTGQDVLLADLDMDSGILAFLMNSKSQYTILDAVKNVHRLDQSYWKALVSNGNQDLEVIGAPPLGTPREELQPDAFRHVLRFLRSNYDWVVADLGRSLNWLSANLLTDIDETYVVATLDLPSLHQTKQLVHALVDAGHSRNRLHLVLNRMPKRPDLTPNEVQRVLGVPIYEMLPNDYPGLHEAYAERHLLPASSELGKSLSGLAQKIAGVQPKDAKGKQRLNLSIF